jgi:protein arginine N-methyltransferase 1
MTKFIGFLLNMFLRIVRKLKSNPRVMQMYQRMRNKEYFTNLHQHDLMLADTVRIESYYNAITKYVSEGNVVLDLGTGSGILAFFASLRLPKQTYAIDHSEVIETAKAVATHNCLTNITFIKTYSKDLSQRTIPEKVDIIIQEQIGAWLFNENMIECVLDLRDRFLKPGGKILPSRFQLFIEPVQLKHESHIPFIWEQEIHSISFKNLKSLKEKVGREYFFTTIKPYEVDCFLCQPEPLFSFDLETMQAEQIPETLHYRKTSIRDGRLEGFCLYFSAIFDNVISFTTSPLREERSYQSWSIPFYRVESEQHHAGDVIEFTLKMADITNAETWYWRHRSSSSFE